MNNLVRMQHHESIQNASEYSGSIHFPILTSLLDLVKQLFSIEMLQYQMNICFWLKYLVKLKHIRMPNLPEQRYLVMYPHHTFYIVFEHRFIDRFQRKLTFGCGILNFVNLGKVTFSNNVSNIIMAFEILKYPKVFKQIKPSFNNYGFHLICVGYSCEHYTFILESNDYALLQIETSTACTSEFTPEDDGLSGSLQGNEVNLAIFNVYNFAILVVLTFEFV